jgi:hypothetical protein
MLHQTLMYMDPIIQQIPPSNIPGISKSKVLELQGDIKTPSNRSRMKPTTIWLARSGLQLQLSENRSSLLQWLIQEQANIQLHTKFTFHNHNIIPQTASQFVPIRFH